MSETTCYVIASWSGPRKKHLWPPAASIYRRDPAVFLRKHFEAIQRWSKKLDHILVMVPENPDEPEEYTTFLEELEKEGVEIQRRENHNWANGSYNDAFRTRLDDFDYWVMCEDDYSFCCDGFDELLRTCATENGLDFICGFVMNGLIRSCEGLVTKEGLKKIYGRLKTYPGRSPKRLTVPFLRSRVRYRTWQDRSILVKRRTHLIKSPRHAPIGIVPLDWILAAPHSRRLQRKLEDFEVPVW